MTEPGSGTDPHHRKAAAEALQTWRVHLGIPRYALSDPRAAAQMLRPLVGLLADGAPDSTALGIEEMLITAVRAGTADWHYARRPRPVD